MFGAPAGARVGGVQAARTTTGNADTPAAAARSAAELCGADVRELENLDELSQAFELFNSIWGGDESVAVPMNVMKAMAHARNYIAGAWQGGRLVGASLAFAWGELSTRALHSHISGVAEGSQGRGIGYALKLHQRAWAADRGYDRITWTFDPLVQRNAWFNLTKLGARIEEYQPDFYGPMNDGINAGDPTDRCVAVWDVEPAGPPRRGEGDLSGAVELLVCGEDDAPVVTEAASGTWKEAAVLSCQVPRDVIELRRSDPALALRWRGALRSTMGTAIDAGFVASAITRDGRYILERYTPREETR
jgi:predicted GNAT superfamily acetyltransferase